MFKGGDSGAREGIHPARFQRANRSPGENEFARSRGGIQAHGKEFTCSRGGIQAHGKEFTRPDCRGQTEVPARTNSHVQGGGFRRTGRNSPGPMLPID
eukprot:1194460-Prorocentrum_minimum.AAC.3